MSTQTVWLSVLGAALSLCLGCGDTTRLLLTLESEDAEAVTSLYVDLINGGSPKAQIIPLAGTAHALPFDLGLTLENAVAGPVGIEVTAVADGGETLFGATSTGLELGVVNRATLALLLDQDSACGDLEVGGVEECDGPDPAVAGCDNLGLGFTDGPVACNPDCTFDVTACTTCGDGVVEPGEDCDDTNLDGMTCAGLGLVGGVLACDPFTCMFDTAGCAKVCLPGDALCDPMDAQLLLTCNMGQTGYDVTVCPFVCVPDVALGARCAGVTNVPEIVATSCGVGAADLVVMAGQVATISSVPPLITGPGGAINGTVYPVAGDKDLAVFCLGDVTVETAGTLRSGAADWVPVLFADGDIVIEGVVDVSAPSATTTTPGPGGYSGGSETMPAMGPGAGAGSDTSTFTNAPGGGGAGYFSPGAPGGTADGSMGAAGGPAAGVPTLEGIHGGSGGGTGKYGMGSDFDVAGGGGSGAIHLIARGSIIVTVDGEIVARGGDGNSGVSCDDGGGGGGSGGAVLIEASWVDLLHTDAVVVAGGSGGFNVAAMGCSGASGAGGTIWQLLPDTPGGVTGFGNGGGGGAAGRLRVNHFFGTGCGLMAGSDCSVGPLPDFP